MGLIQDWCSAVHILFVIILTYFLGFVEVNASLINVKYFNSIPEISSFYHNYCHTKANNFSLFSP